MAFQLPPLPNFNVQVPDLTQKALEGAQLKNMLSETALRQQLAPLQVQEEQQKVQASTQENMLRQMSIDSNKKMMEFIASGGLSNFVGKGSNAPEGSGFDAMGASQELFKQGIIPEVANPIITHFQNIDKATSEIAKNYGAAAADYLKNRATAHTQLANELDSALSSKDPAGGIPLVLAKFLRNPEGLSQEEIGGLKQLQGLRGDPLVKATQLASATLNLGAEMDKHHAELAETQAKASEAEIAAKEAAAKARGEVTPQMATEQRLKLHLATAEKAAEQAIADGDPRAAAKLLVDGTVAPSQIISSRKPAFAQQAFTAAAQMQPGWSATKADADFKVATSPGQVAFFGSAKSLTDKGGTLDQLAAAGKDIPGGKIPVFNTVADAIKASTGSGPVAKYAAIALGVADDYAKVMGGGQGSDTSREQALRIISASQSPEQRKASLDGIRGAVHSQTESRIGGNTVLQKMYGGNVPGAGGGAFKVPTGAPAAPKEDGHKLKQGDQVIAISQGGHWVAP